MVEVPLEVPLAGGQAVPQVVEVAVEVVLEVAYALAEAVAVLLRRRRPEVEQGRRLDGRDDTEAEEHRGRHRRPLRSQAGPSARTPAAAPVHG